ncbi:hypothetical protein SDC9_02079 [bioreactor metagenome]|uniref:LTD domain-containing protein n=1 Tax=bioreactor metagenome TaxID=1076179 RepID=A0A644SPN4_9ZZZZ
MKRKLLLSLLGFFIIILSNAQVKISEIYFDSNFDEGIGSNDHHYGEFIELYNRSNQSIDMSNWILTDNVGGMSLPQGTIIEPQGFIVITYGATTGTYANIFSSLFPEAQGHQSKTIYQRNIEFNNKGDYIILKDNTGKVIDQLYYSKSDLCKGLGANTTGYCYKTTIDNQFGGSYTTAINKDYTYSIQRQNFDNNSLLVAAKATPFSLIVTDNYSGTGGTGSSGSGGSNTTAPTFTDDNYIYSRTYLTPVTSENPSAQQIQAIQYFDGLGRPKQSIAIKATPKGNDLVTPIVYDGFGREVDSYLPVSMASTNGAIQSLDPSGVINYYSSPRNTTTKDFDLTDIKPFSHKELELSPLDRINKQYQVGNDWSAHPINFGYDTNEIGEVKKYVASSTTAGDMIVSSVYFSSTYGANQLFKNTITDEDGNVSIEFKNGNGKTILIRKILSVTESADTYYVYNEYDNLAYVIPPLAAVKEALQATDLDQLCYQYRYDFWNRLIGKKLPGKGWEYMVYDKQDRLVAAQDANMRDSNQWLFNKYDMYGRVAYTGITKGSNRTEEQIKVDATVGNYVERKTSIEFTQNGLGIYYGNPSNITSYPTTITTLLSVNYYDEYPTGTTYLPTTIESQTVITATAQSTPSNSNAKISTKGLPLASFVKNIEDNGWTKTYTYYDLKARPIGTHSDNYLGGYTRTATKLTFSGKPEYTITYHKKADRSDMVTIKETFEYDNQERLVKHWHQVNTTGNNELLAENIYNEIGQLQAKKVGGNNSAPLQTVDYGYNIRGWMTQINNPANLGDDLFGYKIKYNQVDGLQTPNSNYQNDKVLPKYNGNIAEIDWVTGTDYNPIQKRFGYVYDGLNRLVAGYYQPENNDSGKEYFERLQYDVNGNITELKRSGNIIVGYSTANLIDNLGYTYTGNQLTKVVDTSGKSDGYPSLVTHNTILYDANGNMTKHLDKNISSISYNFLNLPNQITQTTNTSYVYRADGLKLKKLYGDKKTEYLDGFQYENDVLQFVPTTEGYYDFNLKDYIYNFTDHLGNVRLSYRAADGGGFEILEENNYYPFGLKFVNEDLGTKATPSYNYKYNSKELQETGMYDYGARFYMPDIGRWGVVDPLAEKMPSWSPYNMSFNNPLRFIDPTGLAPEQIDPTQFNKTADNKNKLAMREFVNTKEGYEFFAKYAKAGDEIGGVKFTKDGEYHKQGVDIKVTTDVVTGRASGEASHSIENGRLSFTMSIGNGKSFIANGIETIGHESFIHILPQTKDFLDNGKFDFSSGFNKQAINFLKLNIKNFKTDKNEYGWIDHFSEKSSHTARDRYISPILNQYFKSINKNVSQKNINSSIDSFIIGVELGDKANDYIKARNGK